MSGVCSVMDIRGSSGFCFCFSFSFLKDDERVVSPFIGATSLDVSLILYSPHPPPPHPFVTTVLSPL